jgi:hypothetical protein
MMVHGSFVRDPEAAPLGNSRKSRVIGMLVVMAHQTIKMLPPVGHRYILQQQKHR